MKGNDCIFAFVFPSNFLNPDPEASRRRHLFLECVPAGCPEPGRELFIRIRFAAVLFALFVLLLHVRKWLHCLRFRSLYGI